MVMSFKFLDFFLMIGTIGTQWHRENIRFRRALGLWAKGFGGHEKRVIEFHYKRNRFCEKMIRKKRLQIVYTFKSMVFNILQPFFLSNC